MTHDECRDHLSAWLDGALTPEESRGVSEHIVACHECRTLSDEMRSLSAALHALPRHELPGDLKATVLRAAGDAPSRAWMPGPWAVASVAALASVLVVIGVVGLRRPEAPQVARLDASREQDFGSANADLERTPRESASKETLSEPASPAPARRNQERFSPAPPAPPEDKPVGLDDLKKSGDEAKEKRQDRNEAQEVAGITSLSSSVEMDQTTTAAPSAEEPSLLEASSLNYVARLVADGEGAWKLEPVEPPAAAGQKDDGADHGADANARNREKSAEGGSAGVASGPAAAGAPAMAQEGERAPDAARDSRAAQGKMEAGSPNRMVFLVQLDAAGNITSAQLVGARTTSSEIAEAARKLLIGTRYPGSPMGRFSTATVQILVGTPPPQ